MVAPFAASLNTYFTDRIVVALDIATDRVKTAAA